METLLYQTLSSDDQVRQHATKELRRHERENYSRYAKSICQVLACEEIQDNIRMSAGLALKNSISQNGWLFTDQQTKNEIKSRVVSLLDTKKRNVANVISQVVAAIAGIELPISQWKDLIQILVDNITLHYKSSNCKQATLQAIGYICESLDPRILSTTQCNSILTAIVEGARREQVDVDTRHAAISALYNSLQFTRNNFENKTERDYIMKVVCDAATQHINSTIDLQVSSYECLNRIMQLYYDKMDDYMSSSLFNLTVYGMIRSDPRITLQAIEFWCTVCDIEIKLKEGINKSSIVAAPLYSFADQSITYILPSIFTLLLKNKDEEYEQDIDDEWNIAKAASNCLSSFAVCSKELVVPQTIEFISNNLLVATHEMQPLLSWNQKEAAIIAFGSIIDGPCKYKTEPLVNQILPVILSSMSDQVIHIRVAASWTLAQIIKKSIQVLNVELVLCDIIPTVIEGLYANQQKIVYNSCLSLIYLSEEIKSPPPIINDSDNSNVIIESTTTGPLSRYMEKILYALLKITQTTNTHYDTKCRNTIYETISSVITHSMQDCISTVDIVTSSILDRLEKLNELAKMNEYNDDDFWMLQTSLLGVLSNCIYRLSDEASVFSDRVMSLVYQITQLYLCSNTKQHESNNCHDSASNITVVEDAFLLVSALINSIGKRFIRYIDDFLRDLSKVIKQQQNQQYKEQPPLPISKLVVIVTDEENRLSLISVGIMSDISCTFGDLIFPYAGEFMKLLMNNLKSDTLHRDVKPATLSCIGDIAQALGPVFVPFVDTVMMALKQAGNMQADKDNQDMMDYVDAIRVGTLEAFVGMMQGLGQNAATKEILLPFVTDFILFASSIAADENRSDRLTRTMFGLLGDIARIYGKRIKCSLIENLLNHLIIENLKGALHFTKGTKEMAHWAQQTVTTAYHKKSTL